MKLSETQTNPPSAHFTLFAQYAGLLGPLAMFFAWRDLNEARFAFMRSDSPSLGLPAVLAPCSPKRISFSLPSTFVLTMCDLSG